MFHSNHYYNNIKASSRSSHYVSVGKVLRLNIYHRKASTFLVFSQVFWSLSYDMNEFRRKDFSADVFYNYSTTN